MKQVKYKYLKKMITVVGLMTIMAVLGGCGTSSVKEETPPVETKAPSTPAADISEEVPIATMEIKDYGTVKMELYPQIASNTVSNFIGLANDKFYDGLTFHRVIPGFMIQGGDPNGDGQGGPGYSIRGEFTGNGHTPNDLLHTKGVLSMARTVDPDSAGSQFFIMTGDAPHLDGQYAAFGKVIEGLDIIEKIGVVETEEGDVPKEKLVIESIRVDTQGVEFPEVVKMP